MTEMSKSPYTAWAIVRGIGVAVMTSVCGSWEPCRKSDR